MNNLIQLAFKALDNVKKYYQGVNDKRLIIIDYSLPSNVKRLQVINRGKVENSYYVAHGANSGLLMATKFSNEEGSHMSNIGVGIMAETYKGKHGLSRRIQGLDVGYNDNMYTRDIVLHGADYCSYEFIQQHGMCGRSWGCPAVNTILAPTLIDVAAKGTVVLMYYPDNEWLTNSKWLRH